MILRDPVHGLISFDGPFERLMMALLATREVQRLRAVRQLGLTSLVFPGAEHSRFAHALGTAHVMVRLQERISECQAALPPEERMDDEARLDALAAACLHDLGHGPFSHLFEEVLPNAEPHEAWTIRAVRDDTTEVHRALESFAEGMAGRVASLLAGHHRLKYLARAISGTVDVDRFDYLLRDSQMSGVRYGLFDLDWLLRAFNLAQVPSGEWTLAVEGRKGLPPIEGFFLGRHFMYRQVYHHKATRAAECLIRAIFMRVAELVRDGTPPDPAPRSLAALARGERVSLDEYLALDDARLVCCFADWSASSDPILADLSARLHARRLPKTLPLPSGDAGRAVREEAYNRVCELVTRRGLRADLSVWLDTTSDTPYTEPADDSSEGLWVVIRHRPVGRLGDVSFLLGELRNKQIDATRLVYPAELRDEVLSAVEGVLP